MKMVAAPRSTSGQVRGTICGHSCRFFRRRGKGSGGEFVVGDKAVPAGTCKQSAQTIP